MKIILGITVLLICLSTPTIVFSSENEKGMMLRDATQRGQLTDELIKIIKKLSENPKGWSALSWAISQNDYHSALMIVDFCSDIDRIDDKYSPLNRLCWAAMTQNTLMPIQITLLKKLIDSGASVSGNLATNTSPLAICCLHGIKDYIDIILRKKIDINQFGGLPLRMAIRRGDVDLVKYLISKGANPKLPAILSIAVQEYQIDILDLIFRSGGDIQQTGLLRIALIPGIYNGNQDKQLNMLRFLLNKGANPNNLIGIQDSSTIFNVALQLPAENEKDKIFRQNVINTLLAFGAKIK